MLKNSLKYARPFQDWIGIWKCWLGNKMLVRTLCFLLHFEQLLLIVIFQFYTWCNVSCKPETWTVTLEPFARQNRSKRFLLVTDNGNEFRLSFTGRQEEQGTSTYCWTCCVYLQSGAREEDKLSQPVMFDIWPSPRNILFPTARPTQCIRRAISGAVQSATRLSIDSN